MSRSHHFIVDLNVKEYKELENKVNKVIYHLDSLFVNSIEFLWSVTGSSTQEVSEGVNIV